MIFSEWRDHYLYHFRRFLLSSEMKEFTSDNVRDYALQNGLESPSNPNWWGLAANEANKAQIAILTNRVQKSNRASSHGRRNFVWVAA